MIETAAGPTRVAAPTPEPGPGTFAGAPHPRVALLSNGRYSVVITGAGGGSAAWRDLDVTRWREDTTRDCWGQFCYVRDRESGAMWYTGSAGWLYRVALEAILGFRLAGDTLRVEPCIPAGWAGYEVTFRYRSATYRIHVENPAWAGRGVRSAAVDGQPVPGGAVPLRDDGRVHDVRVVLG